MKNTQKYNTFWAFLKSRRGHFGRIPTMALEAYSDKNWPKDADRLSSVLFYLKNKNWNKGTVSCIEDAWAEWKSLGNGEIGDDISGCSYCGKINAECTCDIGACMTCMEAFDDCWCDRPKDATRPDLTDKVYFMYDGTAIKIGHTTKSLKARASGMQTGNPRIIQILGYMKGNFKTEGEIQKYFDRHKIRDEWFRPHSEILIYIKDKCKDADEDMLKSVKRSDS